MSDAETVRKRDLVTAIPNKRAWWRAYDKPLAWHEWANVEANILAALPTLTEDDVYAAIRPEYRTERPGPDGVGSADNRAREAARRIFGRIPSSALAATRTARRCPNCGILVNAAEASK